ncbi:alpha-amylase family glycosyl hydrolase [Haloarcula litorea]|uniref:alpha-amylase family glycosyl hydrolase n=1 Tax=Haloarcula litorea TaxID=3032579 RepID=UPI0023E8CC40|nr:alpha-amylase family glycosyl hydrolase [Halomicroarcula sp. GDY20]
MHHPGPPRFCTVGESVELAPRSPDPDAEFAWRLVDSPTDSDVALDDAPVVHLEPDAAGTYRAELTAPDGTHEQVVRAFPARARETVRFSVDETDVAEGDPDDVADAEECVVMGRFNDFTMGSHWATERDGEWTIETELPPGTHEAIFAFDGEFDPFATDEVTVAGAGRPRIELAAERDGESAVVTADARAAPDGSDPEVEFHLDTRDALAEADVTVEGPELRVPVDALPDLARVHAVAVAEQHSVADTLELRADGDGLTVDRPADAPEWAADATIYEIFVREFVGDIAETSFAEIERRVPYIESLGVDVVWFTPVVQSPTRHGYHITDLFDTADDLGTRAEFESLVETIRDHGMKVIFDLVVNHTSRDHPYFQFHRSGVPGYEDHYERVPESEDVTDVDWAGDDAAGIYFNWTRIPNVNYDSLEVRRWMLDVVEEWSDVVDGYRCDVAWGVPHGFWKEVREDLKADDEAFLLLDETVPRDAAFRENEFDVHYDTDCYETLREIGQGEEPATALFDALAESPRRGYPERAVHMRYVDNHDESRYIADCGEDALRAAAAATFTLPGAPMIYAGQERGVEEQRGTMRWHDGDADLTDFHRRLVSLRGEHSALRARGVGPLDPTVVSGDDDRVVAYTRSDGDETLAVVLNFGSEPATVALDAAVDGEDLLSGAAAAAADGLRVADAVVTRVE